MRVLLNGIRLVASSHDLPHRSLIKLLPQEKLAAQWR